MSLNTTTATKRPRKPAGESIGSFPKRAAPKKSGVTVRQGKPAKATKTTRAASKRTPQVEFKRDGKGEMRWHFTMNGRVMADSGEGYASMQSAQRAFDRFAELVRTTAILVNKAA